MKTAMQELFERLEEYKKKYDKDSIEYEIFGMASGMAWCRLEKEKKQIIEAVNYGLERFGDISEDYYNQTYS